MATEDMWDEKKKFVKRSRFDVTSKWCKCMHNQMKVRNNALICCCNSN